MAGSIYLRVGPNDVRSASANQYAPATNAHDPNPPLQLEDGVTFRLPLVTRWERRDWYVATTSGTAPTPFALIAPAPVVPFAQLDWTNPRSPLYPIALRTWTLSNSIDVLAATPFVTYQYDWPLPVRLRLPNASLTHTASMRIEVLGQAPLVGPDQPNPLRAPLPVSARTHTASMPIDVLAQVPLVGPDQPNPVRARAVQQQDAQPNLQTTLLAAPQVAPFSQSDWPNPTVAKRAQQPERIGGVVDAGDPRRGVVLDVPGRPTHPIELRTQATNLLQGTLSIPPGTPVPAFDWPLPGRYAHPIGLRTWSVNLLQSTLFPGDPLRPFDWPLPGRYPHPIGARTWTLNLLQSTLRPPDPFAPVDFPNPVRAPRAALTWTENLLQRTLFPGNPLRGVVQDNPLIARRSRDLLTWVSSPRPAEAVERASLLRTYPVQPQIRVLVLDLQDRVLIISPQDRQEGV